ncbi:histidine kinase [Aliiglaciecola sp. CAU 1673]|uniref:sensor histidine kinase n=1 Tax=Aliiglaciecola sp. CAU 1673 TaxID=3032595 RepID=UPI0023DB0B79|nr:histidine kinase [Aliiglaciecola sp. CAU 1673]MDF2180361.1 histidine kinase [Aliiglaciecola sp. CAU 1673]
MFEHVSHLLYGDNHWQGALFGPLFAMAFTGMMALYYERSSERPVIERVAVLLVLGLITLLFWHNLTRVLHYQIELDTLLQQPWLKWFSGGSYSFLLLLTWAAFYLGAFTYLDKKAQQKELENIKHTARDAQLAQLRYQLNPHFLFNVLNSIDVAILEKHNDTAHQMVVKLSAFLRSTLEHKLEHKIQLKQELDLLKSYVAIEQQRFHQQIDFQLEVDNTCLQAFVPPLLLQPLIENAIKFSWQLGKDCSIKLKACQQNDQLLIEIANAFSELHQGKSQGTGTGLANVKERLAVLYGKDAALKVTEQDGLFRVTVRLPWEVEA